MTPSKINLADKLAKFSDTWNPRVVGNYNGNDLRVVKVEGEFVWHSHADTDELFLVLSGELTMHFRDRVEVLKPGEVIVVPRGTEHKPAAARECHMLVMDAEGTINTGEVADTNLTRETLERI
ncbi:MAG: cupin domain-containing protein [Alphaproteobacteria bacterium]|nr:cupin domain-containing protein [Alphaproteobacteria bacterium]